MATKYLILEGIEIPGDPGDLPSGDPDAESGTSEVVWRPVRNEDGELRIITATGQDGALNRLEATLPDDASGTWKAVPYRSWKGGRSLAPVTRRARLPFED